MGLSAATILLGTGAASASTAGPAIPDNCVGFGVVCLNIVGTGLYVQYVTVENGDESPGYGYIENEGDGAIHRSPNQLGPGQSWSYTFNRDVKNDDEICGWIGSDPGQKACRQVYA